MKVIYDKKEYFVNINDDDNNITIHDIKQLFQEQYFPLENLRLIFQGKILLDSTILSSIPGGQYAKLTLVGSKTSIQPLESQNSHLIKNDLIQNNSNSRTNSSSSSTLVKREYHKEGYGFNQFETLPRLPNEKQALEVLQNLASEAGVLAVMCKYKWNVNILGELYPEGYVGVSEVCVLGLNVNHGEKIMLRIRTDDIKGFRKYLSIKQVLCHELAHMVHSEHNDDFYQLMRKIEKDVIELDWTKSKFYRLIDQRVERYYDNSYPHSSTRSSTVISIENDMNMNVRDCENDSNISNVIQQSKSEDVQQHENIGNIIFNNSIEVPQVMTESNNIDITESNNIELSKISNVTKMLETIDDTLVNLYSHELTHITQDKFLLFALSCRDMVKLWEDDSNSNSIEDIKWCIHIILKIFTNIRKNPNDMKLKIIKKSSKTLQKLISLTRQCIIDVMKTGGFRDEDDKYNMTYIDDSFLYFIVELMNSMNNVYAE